MHTRHRQDYKGYHCAAIYDDTASFLNEVSLCRWPFCKLVGCGSGTYNRMKKGYWCLTLTRFSQPCSEYLIKFIRLYTFHKKIYKRQNYVKKKVFLTVPVQFLTVCIKIRTNYYVHKVLYENSITTEKRINLLINTRNFGK